MEPQEILVATHQWKATHQAIHGPLTRAEHELVNELTEFLVLCAQTLEPMHSSAIPMLADLP